MHICQHICKLIKDTAPFDKENFKLRKRHIRKACKLSNNSAPGPDGISYKAWRKLNDLAVNTLYGAFKEMVANDGPDKMKDQYPDFNASPLFFCPRKPAAPFLTVKINISLKQFTEKYTQEFFKDIKALNIEKADLYPKATDHVDEMIDFVKDLVKEGIAYEKLNSVYYAISNGTCACVCVCMSVMTVRSLKSNRSTVVMCSLVYRICAALGF